MRNEKNDYSLFCFVQSVTYYGYCGQAEHFPPVTTLWSLSYRQQRERRQRESAKPTSNKSITAACNIDSESQLYPVQHHYVPDTQTQLLRNHTF